MQALLGGILKPESSSLIITYIISNYESKNILKVKHDRKKIWETYVKEIGCAK